MRWMSDRDGGPYYGFVRVNGVDTQMVWALEPDIKDRTPAQEARRWSLAEDYDDVSEKEDDERQRMWRLQMKYAHTDAVAIVVREAMKNAQPGGRTEP